MRIKIESFKNSPIVIPVVVCALIVMSTVVTSGASIVAYKPLEDVSIVAFKYVLGGF